MSNLVKVSIRSFMNIPNVMKLLSNEFGIDDDIFMYATDSNEFIFRCNSKCLLLENSKELKLSRFEMDDKDNLLCIKKNGFTIEYDNGLPIFTEDSNGHNSMIRFEPLDEPDRDGYDGVALYAQYDLTKDLRCEFQYQHMYRHDGNGVNPTIYPMHLKKYKNVFLDGNYYLEDQVEYGYLNKKHVYFTKFLMEKDDLDLNVVAVKENGILDYLTNGVSSYTEDEILRYSRVKYITKSKYCVTLFPYSAIYKLEDIKQLVEDCGFHSEVPSMLLDIYNSNDGDVNRILSLVEQIRNVDNINDENMRLSFHLYE